MIKSRKVYWQGVQHEWAEEECIFLVGKPEGKRSLGRQRRRWVDNIKIDLREIGWSGVD
jgi:hypothetical protein